MKKKIYYLILLGIIGCTTSCTNDLDMISPSEGNHSRSVTNNSSDVLFPMQANIAYNKLLSSFNNKISRSLENEKQSYPKYYGGAFINEDNKLVVNIYNEKNEKEINGIIKKLSEDNNVVTQNCKYSYNYLCDLIKTIIDYKQNSNSLSKKIRAYELRDMENKVYVYLSDYNSATINSFKKQISDSQAIEFFECKTIHKQASNTINPGSGIYYEDSQGIHRGSMGYRAIRNKAKGIVSAGHFARTEGINIYANFNGTSKYFGKTDEGAIVHGAVDACFIKLNSGFEASNAVGDEVLHTVALTPAVNTIVNLRSSAGHKWGPIKALNAGKDYGDGDVLSNLISIEYNEQTIDGESGGVVYAVDSSTKLRFTVGIHHGLINGRGTASKAVEINKSLGLTQY